MAEGLSVWYVQSTCSTDHLGLPTTAAAMQSRPMPAIRAVHGDSEIVLVSGDFLLSLTLTTAPGARPTNDISIKFEI